ncbi:olfactory receptor 145-like [Hypomesus transpacificus]|uniref:olfactory receptor 145-like n=1 Tax=Hypomesus transpacificus TaxID=137520 RepID=UPI001F0840B9|nr:olfactory receptor 145-like [Hypomesus transpacificus]
MSSLISREEVNNTVVHPAQFFLLGITGIPHIKYYYAFLFCVYMVSLLGNTFVMTVILVDRSLHTPKYLAVFNLAFTDICGSTTLVYPILSHFLFGSQVVSYNECLTSFFFVFLFLSMQSFNLTTLAYDRLVAICYPLRYYMIVSPKAMLQIISGEWVMSSSLIMIMLVFLTRLSYCRSREIQGYFCDHGPLFRLACNDNLPSKLIGRLNPVFMIWLPLVFIIVTYAFITSTLLRISARERVKAMRTCTSHLMLVGLFYLPYGATFALGDIPTNIRIINLSLTSTLAPTLNPIIYVLKTDEFKVSAKKMVKTAKGAISPSER